MLEMPREACRQRSGSLQSHASGDVLLTVLQSPRSDFDSSYTYKKIDTPIKERRSGNSDSQVEETMSRRHKAAAGEIEVHE